MDWKCEAREKLIDYEARLQALENIPNEIHRLELEYGSIRSGMGNSVSVQTSESRREDAMITNIVRRQELERRLENAKIWVNMVKKGLECLNQDERMILDRLYIHPTRGAFGKLMEDTGLEKSQLYRRRDKALRHFTLALYGISEC